MSSPAQVTSPNGIDDVKCARDVDDYGGVVDEKEVLGRLPSLMFAQYCTGCRGSLFAWNRLKPILISPDSSHSSPPVPAPFSLALFKRTTMTQDGPEMREKAYRLCRDYLSGAWKRISSSEMIFNPIRGGLSNLLYYCALPNTLHPVGSEPAQVLLRMYGQIHDEGVETVITQSVIFTLLSERCLGPKLFGVFAGGRLEEYIPSRSLKTSELYDPELSCIIAGKLAQVHSLQVPISKEPTWIFDKMLRWINYVQENIQLGHAPKDDKPKVKKLLSFALEKEFDWLKRTLLKVSSPVVFCHNDLQEGNILIHENAKGRDEKLVLIDFEYCSYNYRGFDFANHFCEWCYDYSNTSPPYFKSCLAHYPNRDQQLRFLRAYLDKVETLPPSPSSGLANNVYHQQNTDEAMLKEINTFTLASHFFWGLWSIVNGHVSQIPFGYWDYALARFEAYFQHKARILAENNKRKAPTGIE